MEGGDVENVKKQTVDEVDFTSGYEKQYEEEYRPLRPVKVVPPDPKTAWYRNLSTILMVAFLLAVFVGGSMALITKVFTGSLLKMFIVLGIYIVVAVFLIFMEVKSIHVR